MYSEMYLVTGYIKYWPKLVMFVKSLDNKETPEFILSIFIFYRYIYIVYTHDHDKKNLTEFYQ